MPFSREARPHTINGILFVALFSVAAFSLAQLPLVRHLSISPLVVGIILGIFYGNTLRNHLPPEWNNGIHFCTKMLLRVGIVLFGFRISYQQMSAVGLDGFLLSVTMVVTTFLLGTLVGQKVFKLDADTAMLTAAGSAVCGAAAVLATEPVLRAEPHKSAIAVTQVVLFGSIAMFLYPMLYRLGWMGFDPNTFGLYIGGTIHEVAQVVAAGSAISPATASTAVIVKMTRVILLAPGLIALGVFLSWRQARRAASSDATLATTPTEASSKLKVIIPWFAVIFLAVIGFNSVLTLPTQWLGWINTSDTFILTMAMTALGMETQLSKFKDVGMAPLYTALVMFIWLVVGGAFITQFVVAHF